MTLTLSNLIIIALCALCAWLAAKWLFKKDTEIENRRKSAAELAATLKAMGFVRLPELFINYSVGDYSGMARQITDVAKTLAGGEKAVLAECADVFETLLSVNLRTPEGREVVRMRLAEADKLVAPAAPAAPVADPAV